MKVLLSGLSNDLVELNLARSLAQKGVDLHVIAVEGSRAEAFCRGENIPFTSQTFKGRLDKSAIECCRRLQAEHGFDILHCLTNRALTTGLIAVRRAKPRPAVIGYRGTSGHLSSFDPASHMSYLNRRVDCIICVSDAVRRYLKTFRIPDERLEVIWKGHDPDWYTPAPRRLLGELGIPRDEIAVCFTGNIRPVKGVNFLVDAFARVSIRERLHLLIIGELNDEELRSRIEKNSLVHYAGFREDATALTGACDIAVMPSIKREGLPKAILEAMAQGVPPIVTDVGGMPELVENGKSGLVVPPKDANAIYNAIKVLAGHNFKRRKMGLMAKARIEGPFHFRHTVQKTLDLYERLSRRGGGN